MRIVFLTHQYFPRHIGGTEMYTRSLARRATRNGHDVLIITCREGQSGSRDDFKLNRYEHEGIPVTEIEFNMSLIQPAARAEYDNSFVRLQLKAELERFRPDVAHVMHAMKLSGSSLNVLDELDIPFMVTLSDYWFICPTATLITGEGELCKGAVRPFQCVNCVLKIHDVPYTVDNFAAVGKRKQFLMHSLLKAKRIIALSRFQKEVFIRNGLPEERIEVIEHGLELDGLEVDDLVLDGLNLSSENREMRSKRIGFVGSLVFHKGAHVLIEAMDKIQDQDLICQIFGPARNDAYYLDLATRAQSDRRIELKGAVDPNHLGETLKQLNALVIPALWYENEPLILKAAIHLRVPVLVSRIGSLKDMIEEGVEGFFFEPGSAASLAQSWGKIEQRALNTSIDTGRKIKDMDENAREIMSIYETLAAGEAAYAHASH